MNGQDHLNKLLADTPTIRLLPDHTRDSEGLWYGARRVLEGHLPRLSEHSAWRVVQPHLRNAIHVAAVYRLSGAENLNSWSSQGDLLNAGRPPQALVDPVVMALVRLLVAEETKELSRMLGELEPVLYAYSASRSVDGLEQVLSNDILVSLFSLLQATQAHNP